MIDGILLVDKEKGITSYDVIRKLKKVLGRNIKVGHAGTLDPFATGLLIILFGKATKMVNTIHGYEKVYDVKGKFGIQTNTQDITGEVINIDTESKRPSMNEVSRCVEENFVGEFYQTPPQFSAKKINGEKAYDLARRGEVVNLKPRLVSISQFEVYEYEYPFFSSKIQCSTGTYVRTLIDDLGLKLGIYATAIELRRTSIGGFDVKEAVLSTDIHIDSREEILRRTINI